jgi:hypothetical protein
MKLKVNRLTNMSYKIEDKKYVFFNYEGESIAWTMDFKYAMMLIREFNMEKRDEKKTFV